MTVHTVLGELLPAGVCTTERFGDVPDVALFPEEEAVIARAVAKRRSEFATVRWCAREAMGRLGIAPAPIVPGVRGAPVWPAGVVGSMTHCDGYRASAVARADRLMTIGVDAEPDAALPDGVLTLVASPAEREQVTWLATSAAGPAWDRLLFSAKESVYKAWYPLTGRWLDFDEASITIDPTAGRFYATLLVCGPQTRNGKITGFAGRWSRHAGILMTAIAVRGEPDASR